MESLPFELVEKITDSLSPTELLPLRSVSSQMKEYVDEILRHRSRLPKGTPFKEIIKKLLDRYHIHVRDGEGYDMEGHATYEVNDSVLAGCYIFYEIANHGPTPGMVSVKVRLNGNGKNIDFEGKVKGTIGWSLIRRNPADMELETSIGLIYIKTGPYDPKIIKTVIYGLEDALYGID